MKSVQTTNMIVQLFPGLGLGKGLHSMVFVYFLLMRQEEFPWAMMTFPL